MQSYHLKKNSTQDLNLDADRNAESKLPEFRQLPENLHHWVYDVLMVAINLATDKPATPHKFKHVKFDTLPEYSKF